MSLRYYRAINFTKDYMVKYLNFIYYAGEKERILFYDGTKKIEFSQRPRALRYGSWDFRDLPVALVSGARGNFSTLSFTKDHVNSSDEDDTNQYRVTGGQIDLNLDIEIMATTMIERDNLVDITGIYLAHPFAKDHFLKQDIKLPEPPSIGGEREINQPGIDHPVYSTTLSIRTVSVWQDYEDLNDRLTDIWAEITAYVDLSEDGREEIVEE